MTARVTEIVIDAHDPFAIASFWSAALGIPLADDDEPGDSEAFLDRGDGSTPLLFLRVPDTKEVKNRLHLDICAAEDSTRAAERDRLLALGATVLADRRTDGGGGWITMLDPDGNEFCIVRNSAERAATTPGGDH